MFFKRKRNNFVEVQNDKLLIWNYLTGPIFIFIGALVVIFGMIIAINLIWAEPDNKGEVDQKTIELRQTNLDNYLEYSKDLIGKINKGYWDNSTYNIESDKGKFTITFLDADILNVVVTNKADQRAEIYRKK